MVLTTEHGKTMTVLEVKLPPALPSPQVLQKPCEQQTLTSNLLFDTFGGPLFSLWIKG
jgi:hypothetical protein